MRDLFPLPCPSNVSSYWTFFRGSNPLKKKGSPNTMNDDYTHQIEDLTHFDFFFFLPAFLYCFLFMVVRIESLPVLLSSEEQGGD